MSDVIADEWGAMPLMLRVEEAATVLRISRSKAYELTTLYRASAGINGLPSIRIGDLLRVPRFALQELVMTGQIVQLIRKDAADSPATASPISKALVDRPHASFVESAAIR